MSGTKKQDYQSDVQAKFQIDNDDIKILSLIQDDPNITHSEIAKRINKSQPAVGARITKLERKHVLNTQKGLNFREVLDMSKIFLLVVNLQTRDPDPVVQELQNCPFVINIFKKTGKYNIMLMLAASRLEKLESIIDTHFRANPMVLSVETSIVVDIRDDFTLPVNWGGLKYDHVPCTHIWQQHKGEEVYPLEEIIIE
ncbi:MAG: Lrp/AsnC family transcriptional regulator [Candidatus Hodarchaeota archaeon]